MAGRVLYITELDLLVDLLSSSSGGKHVKLLAGKL
jgi:hypothetical protein